MTQLEESQFLELYQRFRYQDQIDYYRKRHREFTGAQAQAITISIVLLLLAAIAGAFASIDISWLKIPCLIAAAVLPVLSTTLAAYSALYAFDQQAKLFQDTIYNLQDARELIPAVKPGLSDDAYRGQVGKFVQEVEGIFRSEQGQWGQLAKNMKPHDS